MLAAFAGCDKTQKNTGVDEAGQVESERALLAQEKARLAADKARFIAERDLAEKKANAEKEGTILTQDKARLTAEKTRLAAEMDLAERNANAEAKRLAYERAKLDMEKENFAAEKAKRPSPNTPNAEDEPIVLKGAPSPKMAGSAEEQRKIDEDKAKIEAEQRRSVERLSALARDGGTSKGPHMVGPVPNNAPPAAPPTAMPAVPGTVPATGLPVAVTKPLTRSTPTPTPSPLQRPPAPSSQTREKGLRPVSLEPSRGL